MQLVKKNGSSRRYPAIEPFRTGTLNVSALHALYFEESGNPQGKPVVFLHGGPGSCSDAKMRTYFNPELYRIILYDQRGCGKSVPHASLEQNTTWDLVEDLEKLRKHLLVSKWQVFGGSWGSTLALAYAETYPNSVSELVLRGIFLLRKWEIDWFYQEGASRIYPDAWEPYRDHIPLEERHDFVTAYYRRLTSSDPKVQMAAAKVWSIWEGSTSKLIPDQNFIDHYGQDQFAIAFGRIECHYFVNHAFFKHDDELLRNAGALRKIPAVIVHGRYDLVCPLDNAWALHKVWPESELKIIPDAGHSISEPGIASALIEATDRFSKQ